MNELIEGVLAICTALSPDDRSCLIVDSSAVFGDEFSVGFHISLCTAFRISKTAAVEVKGIDTPAGSNLRTCADTDHKAGEHMSVLHRSRCTRYLEAP